MANSTFLWRYFQEKAQEKHHKISFAEGHELKDAILEELQAFHKRIKIVLDILGNNKLLKYDVVGKGEDISTDTIEISIKSLRGDQNLGIIKIQKELEDSNQGNNGLSLHLKEPGQEEFVSRFYDRDNMQETVKQILEAPLDHFLETLNSDQIEIIAAAQVESFEAEQEPDLKAEEPAATKG